jgi:hypothetical protein
MNSGSSERRIYFRRTASEHHIVSARVRPGHWAAIVNVSDGGALVETARGLRPGTTVDLQFGTPERQTFVRGRVVRCTVTELRSSSVLYHAAIAFEYPIPTRERVAAASSGVDASLDTVRHGAC